MLTSTKIAKRQSEIRQSLAELVGKSEPSEDEIRSMESLDAEYRQNESRYRAALTSEDHERREAGAELETRGGTEWADLCGKFELRQVALSLAEGRALDGATGEVVAEMRQAGGYRGIPVPLEALETRAGETVAGGTPDPRQTRPIIDRLFAASVATRMGVQVLSIPQGEAEWPVVTAGASVGWAASETGAVGTAQAFQTTDVAVKPDHTLGAQMKLTRKSLRQSGQALEQAVRRDMGSAIQAELDRAVFLGSDASGQPAGIVAGASGYSINETAIDAAPTWSIFREAVVRFMVANAINSPSDVKVLARPEMWADLDAQASSTAAPIWEFDRLVAAVGSGNVSLSSNALPAYAGDPEVSKALLTTTVNGVAPAVLALWGGVDMIRDPYSDAASGGLRLTGLLTCDVQVIRAAQLEVLTDIERTA